MDPYLYLMAWLALLSIFMLIVRWVVEHFDL